MLSFLTTVKDARRRSDPFCRLPPARSASPPGGLLLQRARQVKAAQEDEGKGRGALVLALTPCYTGPAHQDADEKSGSIESGSASHVEGDGENYWFFADGGGRFLLAERMKARYTEHHWRSGMRDISGICSSLSIRIT